MENEKYKVGDYLKCKYNGQRVVEGIITDVRPKAIIVRLTKDYVGKNVEWCAGETKLLFIKRIKK